MITQRDSVNLIDVKLEQLQGKRSGLISLEMHNDDTSKLAQSQRVCSNELDVQHIPRQPTTWIMTAEARVSGELGQRRVHSDNALDREHTFGLRRVDLGHHISQTSPARRAEPSLRRWQKSKRGDARNFDHVCGNGAKLSDQFEALGLDTRPMAANRFTAES